MKWSNLLFINFFLFISLILPLTADESAIDFFTEGENALYQGNYTKAVESFNEALSLNPHYKEALKGISESYYYLEKLETALLYAQKALFLGKEDKTIKNMIARIQIGMGNLKGAEDIYEEILTLEPNNQNARMGLAEVYILSNRYQEAINEYEKNLMISPDSRRSIISLVLLHDSRQEFEKAEEYLNLAHFYHPEEEITYFTGMIHYMETSKWDEALNESSRLLSLNPDYPEMNYYLGIIYFNLERYQLSQMYFMNCIQSSPKEVNAEYWYMLGLSHWKQDNDEDAIHSLKMALSISPEDERIRLFLEYLFRNYPEYIDIEEEAFISEHYLTTGIRFQEDYYFEKALSAYRRALMFNADSSRVWLKYCELLKVMGYPEKYMDKMKAFLASNDLDDSDLQLAIDLQADVTEDYFVEEWNLDQFSLSHNPFQLSCFLKSNRIDLLYFEKAILSLIQDELSQYIFIDFSHIDSSGAVSFAESYRRAQTDNSDYFILFSLDENERSFSLSADFHLSSTGALIASRTFVKTGNDRIYRAVNELSDFIISLVPKIGSIVKLQDNKGIINLGSWHNIGENDEFYIIQENEYSLTHQDPFYFFDGEFKLGSASIEYLGEEASMVNIVPTTPYSLINHNDSVILVIKDEEGNPLFEPELIQTGPAREIKDLLLKIR